MSFINFDANDSIFFERELEQIKNKVYQVAYAPLNAMKLIPVDTTTDPGANYVTYTKYDQVGYATIVADYADDIKPVNIRGEQFTSPIRSVADAFYVSIQDIRAARFANKPMESRLAETCYEAILQRMNNIAFFGDSPSGLPGWLTNTSIDNQLVAGTTVDARKWENKTPDEVLEDMFEPIRKMLDTTKNIEVPDTMAMPIKQYQHIATTPRSNLSDTTILQFFQRTYPNINVVMAHELKGAFTNLTDGFVVYKNSANKFWQEIPLEFEMGSPQWNNLAYKVICNARYGGVVVAYPASQAFRRGI